MSYIKAIEAAGAKVEAVEHFGSYQGDLIAKVRVGRKRGFIAIGYGSCSVCDAWEHFSDSFGWDYEPTTEDLRKFGQSYVEGAYLGKAEVDRLIASYQRQAEDGDYEARDIIAWIEANR